MIALRSKITVQTTTGPQPGVIVGRCLGKALYDVRMEDGQIIADVAGTAIQERKQ